MADVCEERRDVAISIAERNGMEKLRSARNDREIRSVQRSPRIHPIALVSVGSAD
jgi:hypothetical protein